MEILNLVNTWQFNLVGYWISVVAFFQFYKLAVRNAKRDGAATILLQLVGGLSVLIFAPLFSFKFPTDWRVYGLLFFAMIFYAINDRLQTTARKNLPVSTFSILSQLQTVFLITFGITIFREPFVLTKLIGALVIIAGNALLLYKKGAFQLNSYILTAIGATFSFAIAVSIDIGISKQFNLPIYIALTLIVPALMVKLVEKIPWQSIVEEWKAEDRKYYLITGVVWGLLIIFALRSFQFGEVTTIVPLQALSVPLNVIFAYLVFKEHDNRLKKIIASILVVIGMYLTVS